MISHFFFKEKEIFEFSFSSSLETPPHRTVGPGTPTRAVIATIYTLAGTGANPSGHSVRNPGSQYGPRRWMMFKGREDGDAAVEATIVNLECFVLFRLLGPCTTPRFEKKRLLHRRATSEPNM